MSIIGKWLVLRVLASYGYLSIVVIFGAKGEGYQIVSLGLELVVVKRYI